MHTSASHLNCISTTTFSLGRYFAASVYAVAVNVINKKIVTSGNVGDPSFMYYLSDGIYGTFNFLAFNDHYTVTPLTLKV